MPVDSLSYSSFIQLLRNPMIFKLKEVLNVYDGKMSVSAMIGRAGHAALEAYYGGNPDVDMPDDDAEMRAVAIQCGLNLIENTDDGYINYGKTGTREEILKGYAQAMEFYFAEEPEYHEILACEQKLTAELTTDSGDKLPIPASGVPDLVTRNAAGEIEIIDHKFTKTFTNYETEDYIKIVQAMFMYHLVKATMKEAPARMIFREIKRTKNSNGSSGDPQVRDWAIPFDHKPYFVLFYNLYKDVARYLMNDPIFLPNLSDPFDGEHAGMMYAQGLMSADMSDVEVVHKVRDVARVTKKFVSSNLDRAENKHLPIAERIKMRLAEFGVPIEPIDSVVGAQVTQHRFKVSAGVRMATIHKHKADIQRTVATKGEIRILTPIPGTEYVGIEVENQSRNVANLTKQHLTPGTMELPIGVDVSGEVTKIDLREMPHLLIAGATGSGKSVTLTTIIEALTKQMTADQMHLLLIDPKRVELTKYGRKLHLQGKSVIYEPREAVRELLGLKDEMEKRYKLLEKAGKRDLAEYNASRRVETARLPYLVCVVDEFADLILQSRSEEKKARGYSTRSTNWLIKSILQKAEELREQIDPAQIRAMKKNELIEVLQELDSRDIMMSPQADVEHLVARLAQLGRAAGIHIVIATQRPSVDVITGLIKANFPTRIAFRTSSPTDSIVILGEPGAEKLAGKGDMLLMGPMISGGKARLQGLMIK